MASGLNDDSDSSRGLRSMPSSARQRRGSVSVFRGFNHHLAGSLRQDIEWLGWIRQLTTHGRWAAWSPDMTQIAFSSDYQSSDIDLWLVNADGTQARRVLVRPGSDIDVLWTPSSRILFAGFVDRRQSYEIFAFDPITSALTRLTTSLDRDFEPAPSFDGASIAFYSARKPDGIYVMSATGASPQLVIAKGRQPSWGP